jgi:FlaA1/EpsC-like NDP-sugar epimerase
LERLLEARRQARAFFGRDPDEGDPYPPKPPRRDLWAPRALVIVASIALVDLLMVIFSYAIARAAWPLHRSPDLGELARVSPVILATIPCWLIVFQLFGLYSRDQVLEPSLRLTKLLEATSVSIFAVIVIAFATGDDKLHRAWVLVLWIVATVLIVSGRIVTLRLALLLNQDHGLGPPTS